MSNLEILIMVASLVSCLFSAGIIITILFFRNMQRGNFMPIILFMSISDFGMNSTSFLGFPSDGSALCWMQGIFQSYFAICSWFWTTILAYRVYTIVRYGQCNLTNFQMHTFAWGLPVILTLIPISTNNYGASEFDTQWCVLTRRGNNAAWLTQFWSYVAFFVWLFMCIGLMIVWQCLISYHFRNSPMKEVVRRTYDKVYLYPVVMIVCWVLNYYCVDLHSRDAGKTLNAMSMLFGISNGIFSALIFMFKSEEARRRWKAYFYPPKEANFDDFVEPPIQADFDEDYQSNTNFTSNTGGTGTGTGTGYTERSSVTNDSEIDMTEFAAPYISPFH